jgi:RNA polymerase sigma-70 factor, ECF subfamily
MDSKEEFEKIVRQEMNRVFNVAYRLCGNFHQAGDITQETFLRAYQSFHSFEGLSKISTYLYRIACNVWKNTLRKKRIQSFTSYFFEKNTERIDVPDSENSSMEEDIRRDEKNRIVQECINTLPPGDKAIIVLRDMEGYSYEEIAVILKCRIGTVKSRLARARNKLSEKILPLREKLER